MGGRGRKAGLISRRQPERACWRLSKGRWAQGGVVRNGKGAQSASIFLMASKTLS